jgi:prepilin-type N-terminal cleavage/methylation domain-containing protein
MKSNIKSTKGFTLVEMLGVLAIIAILISVIAVGVLAAINRAAVVATASNFKNMETAIVGFVALPASGGTIPLTEGNGDIIDIVNDNIVTIESDPDDGSYTLNQVLVASGLIDRQISWRLGRDGANRVNLAAERTFRISKNAFNSEDDDTNATGDTNWTDVNRAEASKVVAAAMTSNGIDTDEFAISGVDFWLDGRSGLQASRAAYAILKEVSIKDACALSRELNGVFDDTDSPAFKNAPNTTWQGRGRFVFAASTNATNVTCYYYLASF